jgi:gliding motility-associated-like protein
VSKLKIYLFFVLTLFFIAKAQATHIKAADLFAKINPNSLNTADAHREVKFTLNVYCDKAKVELSGDNMNDCEQRLANCATLDFGDGTTSQQRYSSIKDMGNNTLFYVYEFVHTFPADKINRGYTIGYRDENRNGGIANMGGGTSSQIALYISMELGIEAGIGQNQTPQLSIPPLDLGQVGRLFIHNPGAYDVDGDSIAYVAYFPQSSKGLAVTPYSDPQEIAGGTTSDGLSPAFYSVNSKTGDVIWNAPGSTGLFNVAFKIEEWRTFGRSRILLSYAIRDMQIEIKPATNNPPVITVPPEVCIEAGSTYSTTINIDDPEKDQVILKPYGELFEELSPKATLTPSISPLSTSFNSTFKWVTNCSSIRKRPYQAYFKATDLVGTSLLSLTDIKSHSIRVVGPKPTGLKAVVDTNKIKLTWNKYTCNSKVNKLLVYRRVGCDTIKRQNCVTGAPNDSYVLIATLNIDSTRYFDRNVKRGNVYAYAIAVQFVDGVDLKSYSYPSTDITCVDLPLIAPIITNVSFEGNAKNTVFVKWQKPIDIDTSKVQGPFQYVLFKKTKGEANYTRLHIFNSTLIAKDTSFLDTAILPNKSYVYFVQFKYFTKNVGPKILEDSSEISTIVSLVTTPIRKGIRLTWEASTPWQNNTNFYHYIYRKLKTDADFVLIDSVKFNQQTSTFSYNDIGQYQNTPLIQRDTVSYYVTTGGSYLNLKITPTILLNNSFINSNIILDSDPPCAPSLEPDKSSCENFTQVLPYKNTLNWTPQPYSEQCDSDIVRYNIYLNTGGENSETRLLATVVGDSITNYIHANLKSIEGCYSVTALDAVGNESAKSNLLCFENCYSYHLPNIFTPNGSGVNDLFRPIPPSPKFVETVKFKVFNRWGGKVFEQNDDIYLNWDGSGLPDGIYFYTAKVTYASSTENIRTEELKGWVEILR